MPTTLLIAPPRIFRPSYGGPATQCNDSETAVQRWFNGLTLISIYISPFLHRPYMDHLILELYTHLARQIEKCILPKWKVCARVCSCLVGGHLIKRSRSFIIFLSFRCRVFRTIKTVCAFSIATKVIKK